MAEGGLDEIEMNKLVEKYPEYNEYKSLNDQNEYLEKDTPEKRKYNTIKNNIDIIQEKFDRTDGKTVTMKGSNIKLPSTEFGDVSGERFELAFCETQKTQQKLLKLNEFDRGLL